MSEFDKAELALAAPARPVSCYELIVVGGGPAGMAAALAACRSGLRHVLILEREPCLGGILNQCIHNGFGLHYFHTELTGPEYAWRFVEQLRDTCVEVEVDAMVLKLTNGSDWRCVHVLSKAHGYRELRAKAVVLAMGCRERTRMQIQIPGTRAAGIFNAGQAQAYVNLHGEMVGRRVIILGSGDVGLIMARRLTLEGAEVVACVELKPYPGGLARNIVQCLDDYQIPLYLSHTITEIRGRDRVSAVTVQELDSDGKAIPGTELVYDVDTVLLSVGLIPENELSREAGIEMDPRSAGPKVYENGETSQRGIFACGNVLHVHDLVDYVTEEAIAAGNAAAAFVSEAFRQGAVPDASGVPDSSTVSPSPVLAIKTAPEIAYSVPQRIRLDKAEALTRVFFRVRRIYRNEARIVFRDAEGRRVAAFKRPYMAPGEMEQVRLPLALLRKLDGNILQMSVEEEA